MNDLLVICGIVQQLLADFFRAIVYSRPLLLYIIRNWKQKSHHTFPSIQHIIVCTLLYTLVYLYYIFSDLFFFSSSFLQLLLCLSPVDSGCGGGLLLLFFASLQIVMCELIFNCWQQQTSFVGIFFLTYYYLPLQLVWQSSTRFFCFQFIFAVSFTFCLFTFRAPASYLCITSTFHATIPHAPNFTKFMFRRGGWGLCGLFKISAENNV